MPKKIYPEGQKKKTNPLVKEVWESKIKQSPSKNKHISYSSLSTYNKCPKLWELQYLRGEVPFKQNIYTCFVLDNDLSKFFFKLTNSYSKCLARNQSA